MAVTRDIDRGYRALVDRIYGMGSPKIRVGILDGDVPKEPSGGDAVTLLQVATWNHFGVENADGSPHIPARPFISAWFDENEARLRQELAILMRAVVAGKYTKEQILALMGQRCVGEIQARIAEGVDPPNAESTIKRKGSSKPLIDTGQLRSGVTYKVDP